MDKGNLLKNEEEKDTKIEMIQINVNENQDNKNVIAKIENSKYQFNTKTVFIFKILVFLLIIISIFIIIYIAFFNNNKGLNNNINDNKIQVEKKNDNKKQPEKTESNKKSEKEIADDSKKQVIETADDDKKQVIEITDADEKHEVESTDKDKKQEIESTDKDKKHEIESTDADEKHEIESTDKDKKQEIERKDDDNNKALIEIIKKTPNHFEYFQDKNYKILDDDIKNIFDSGESKQIKNAIFRKLCKIKVIDSAKTSSDKFKLSELIELYLNNQNNPEFITKNFITDAPIQITDKYFDKENLLNSRKLILEPIYLTKEYISFIKNVNYKPKEKIRYNVKILKASDEIENKKISYQDYFKACEVEQKLIGVSNDYYVNYKYDKTMPIVTVIVIAFNRQNLFVKTLRSIQNQSYKNLEIIFIDDGSSDKTSQLIEEEMKKDSRIRLFRNTKNMKQFRSRINAAIYSNGDYIDFVDSDDIYASNIIIEKCLYLSRKYDIDSIDYGNIGYANRNIESVTEKYNKQFGRTITGNTIEYDNFSTKTLNIVMRFVKSEVFFKGIYNIGTHFYNKLIGSAEDDFFIYAINTASKSYLYLDYFAYIPFVTPNSDWRSFFKHAELNTHSRFEPLKFIFKIKLYDINKTAKLIYEFPNFFSSLYHFQKNYDELNLVLIQILMDKNLSNDNKYKMKRMLMENIDR